MARTATKRKSKKVMSSPRRGSNASRVAEEKHIGSETIDWTNQTEDKVLETLRHYGYFYDLKKDGNKWACEWVKKNYTKQEYTNFRAAEVWRCPMTVCSLCKMMLNGAIFEEERMTWIKSYIQKTIDVGASRKSSDEEETNVVHVRKKSPADIVKDKTSEFISNIEEAIDNLEEVSIYTLLQQEDAAYITAKAIADFYTPALKELEELTGRKPKNPSDEYEQLVEGYSHMTKKEQKAFHKYISDIVTDAEKYMASKKATRKVRSKKPVTIAQQVRKVKYMANSSEYQVTSVSPDNIIGASIVWLFNVKTRNLTRIESTASVGLGVKGTTIINIDDDKCDKKKLRKPEEFIATTAKTTKIKMNREYNSIKTKPRASNGRINADTIILKVFK